MHKQIFHPFEDRLSRDIRNSLSTAFVKSIEGTSQNILEDISSPFLEKYPNSCYSHYINERLNKYKQAFPILLSGSNKPLWRGFVLWDLGLFFEVHEILEHAWYNAVGDEKLTLQAVIRAAGVYIKLEYGYLAQAEKMAAKAVTILKKNTVILAPYCETERLINALEKLSAPPQNILKNSIYPLVHKQT